MVSCKFHLVILVFVWQLWCLYHYMSSHHQQSLEVIGIGSSSQTVLCSPLQTWLLSLSSLGCSSSSRAVSVKASVQYAVGTELKHQLPDSVRDTSWRHTRCKEQDFPWIGRLSCKQTLGSRTVRHRSTTLWSGWLAFRLTDTYHTTLWSSCHDLTDWFLPIVINQLNLLGRPIVGETVAYYDVKAIYRRKLRSSFRLKFRLWIEKVTYRIDFSCRQLESEGRRHGPDRWLSCR